MGCEGGVVLSLCSPTPGAAAAATSHPHALHHHQHQPSATSTNTWVAVVSRLCGFPTAAAPGPSPFTTATDPAPASAPSAEVASSPQPQGTEGGLQQQQAAHTMVVLTWKGRSVTAHHIPQPRPHVTPPTPPSSGGGNNKRDTNRATNSAYQGSSHNGGGEHSNSSSGSSSTDDKELGAFWELLDREIRPLPPLANSTDSQQIFSDHKEMARAYLVMQQELFNLKKSKTDLEGKLSEAEQLEQMNNHRYQEMIRKLEGKRENLRNNHKRLRQQLEHIKSQTARGASHNHPPP